MSRVIAHIDLNAFFVRAEEIRNPSLEGKAVAIGHEGRSGIISTCSYKAREKGVHSGMPTFQAKELCPELILCPGDFPYYTVLSHAFLRFVRRYTKAVEQASVDECYADFTDQVRGIPDVPAYFRSLQEKLFQETGLRCSIGVSMTKFLAKMGSDYRKPMGLTILRKKDIAVLLYPLPIESMYGIGKKTAPRLREAGIRTIGDLALRCREEDPEVMKITGKFFHVLRDWLEGKGDDKVITEPWDPKSVGNSMTLPHDTESYEEIRTAFGSLAQEVSERARKDGKIGSTVQITVKDTSFRSHCKSVTFATPTNDSRTILRHAMSLYDKNFIGLSLRLVGVTLQNLVSIKDMAIQMTLFDYEKHEEESATKLLISELNRKLKKNLLLRASEVAGKEKDDGSH